MEIVIFAALLFMLWQLKKLAVHFYPLPPIPVSSVDKIFLLLFLMILGGSAVWVAGAFFIDGIRWIF